MAILMRGLELAVDDAERQARSVTMHFLRAPEAGPVEVSATVERRGRSLTSVSGRLEQDGKLIGLALGAYSKPWESPTLDDETPMPDVPEADAVDAPSQRQLRGQAPPAFVDRMVMQHRFGEVPFSGADRGETGGWLGIRQDRPIDSLAIAVLADAWFPAPWPRLAELAPAPTIDLTIHFRAPLPVSVERSETRTKGGSAQLLLGQFTSRHVRDGFFEEDGLLWAPDGTLVAQSRQLGLLLRARVA